MAKTPTATARVAVTARGAELLALISAAGAAGLMLTQEEGLDAVNSGHAVVDAGTTEGNTAKVTLTDAGTAALTSNGGASAKFAIDTDVPMPEATSQRRGRQSSYPFDDLGVNASFHVAPVGGETVEALAKRMQSSVSGARGRFTTETGETKAVNVKTYQLDEDGKPVKGEDGKKIETGVSVVNRPVKAVGRDFKLGIVDASDPRGAGVRIWRTA